MLQRLLDDARQGVRILTKSRGLSAAAALLVTLVIGGNATIFSMVSGIVRRPAPAVTANGLVSFTIAGRPGAPFIAYADYAQYAAQTTTLRSLAAFGWSRAAVATPLGTYVLQATPVTRNGPCSLRERVSPALPTFGPARPSKEL